MSRIGLAPGVAEAVSSVTDPASQRLFYLLLEDNHRIHSALESSVEASNAATAGLLSVSVSLDTTRSQLDSIIQHLSTVRTGAPASVLYPMVINASSPIVSGSGTDASDRSSGSKESVSSPDGPLKCPFCPARHDTEKVHCQHMVRLSDRFVGFTDDSRALIHCILTFV